MKPRTLLVLLAVVLALGAFIWFYERKLPSSEERVELQKKILKVEKDDVTAVTVESSKGRVRLERVPAPKVAKKEGDADAPEPSAVPSDEWRMLEPVATRADTFAVDRLLDAVIALERTRTLEDVNAKDVGLDKPRATVRLKTADGEEVLQLGAAVPTGGSLIAGLEGEKGGYVVSDTILSEVEKEPGDWRDRQMFRGEQGTIQKVTLKGAAGGPVVLVKRAAGFWMERPFSDRADHDLVEGLLSDLSGLTAERFSDGSRPLAALGLQPPGEVVEVVFQGGQGGTPPVRVELGSPVTGEAAPEGQTAGELTWARVGDAVFEVRTRLTESARLPPADWRALQLSSLEVHDVESATVLDGRAPLRLTRSGTDWKRGDTLISYLPVSDLLFLMTGARADRLLTPREAQALQAGVAKPLLTFTLRTKTMGEETLILYPPLPEGVPARVSGRQTVLLLPADTLPQVQKKLEEVRTAKPVTPAK